MCRFSKYSRAISGSFQSFDKRGYVWTNRIEPEGAVAMWISTCHPNGTSRLTDGDGNVSMFETHSFRGKPVDVWRNFGHGAAKSAHGIAAHIVNRDKHNVPAFVCTEDGRYARNADGQNGAALADTIHGNVYLPGDLLEIDLSHGDNTTHNPSNAMDNQMKTFFRIVTIWLSICILVQPAKAETKTESYDVIVYGGTAGGIAAAVQARRMRKTAVIIEPSNHLGGLTSGGLGATDIGNKAAIGGISREFYRRVKAYYANDDSWTWQKKSEYKSARQTDRDDAMWTFEPHVAEMILTEMAQEEEVQIHRNERLNRSTGVQKEGSRIVAITMESRAEDYWYVLH